MKVIVEFLSLRINITTSPFSFDLSHKSLDNFTIAETKIKEKIPVFW